MKEHYVSYSQSVKLKELGLGWEAYGKYVDCPNDPTLFSGMIYQPWNLEPDEIIAPTLAQAAKWLLKKKGYYIEVPFSAGNGVDQTDGWLYRIVNVISYKGIDCYITYASPEDALSAGISKALELLGKEDKE